MADITAIKQIIGGEDELTAERIEAEDEFATEMEQWLSEQSERIAAGSQGDQPPPQEFWDAENVALAAFLALFLIRWVEGGITDSAVILSDVQLGISDQVNAAAERWARQHSLRLARGLNRTTRALARQRIAIWFRSGQPMSALVDSLNEIIAPRWRAEMIAQTEVTRARNQASIEVAAQTPGIRRRIWYTRLDERVCPICAPLHGVPERRNGTFPGGFDGPPAHPRCRCDSLAYEVVDVQ